MWRYNHLIRRGWNVVTVDIHRIEYTFYTNVLLGRDGQRKIVRLKGSWNKSALIGREK